MAHIHIDINIWYKFESEEPVGNFILKCVKTNLFIH